MSNKEITLFEGDVRIKASSDPSIYGNGHLNIDGDLSVSGNIIGGVVSGIHSSLAGLLEDDHTQYALLAGRSGGQILIGGTAASNTLTIRSTSNATKGSVLFDETTASTSSSTGALRVSGGIGISSSVDAISSTNGGSITTAGGLAVAKKAFIGTDLSVGGSLTVSGSFVIPHSGLSGLLNDDHTQYALLEGRVGGQILTGGTAATNQLIIRSTTNISKGSVVFDETTASTSSSTGSILTAGGIGISNATDASSSVSGGSITTEGGLAVAKSVYIGTILNIGGLDINSAIATDASKNLVSITNTGTGNNVLSNSPTLVTPILGEASATSLLLSGLNVNSAVATDGSKNLISITNTGTGNNVLATSPTLITPILGVASGTSLLLSSTTTSTSITTGALRLSGGLGISNVTDAISSTNGGSITTAGGLAVAKKAFIGTDLTVGGSLTVSGSFVIPHSGLSGLLNDDHTQYALLAGRVGGQILTGGNAASNTLTIRSTSNLSKGNVLFDETTASTSSSSGSILIAGGIGISNVTDAISSTNGGSITTAGGLAVAKKAFIGTDLSVGGSLTVSGSFVIPHSGLSGLLNDDHTQYALLAGRVGGQILTGGTAASNTLTIRSTSNATKGSVLLDETTSSTSSTTGALRLSGGIGISNVTDAISSTNGGSITTAGGLAVAKKAFIGTDLTVGGSLTVSGSFVIPHSGLSGLLNDDHTQYALLAGRVGGQILTGGTAASNILTIRSTSNATKGSVLLDETTSSTSSTTGALRLSGGLGISNVTDAISSTNGGSITTAGGLAVAKKAFIGTDLTVGGSLTVSGSFVIPHSGLSGLLNDDHTQYALLAGRAGGQILTGGTAASNILTIRSSSNATKGTVLLDETTASTSNMTGALTLLGGVGISNTTDATSITNGGTFTSAGGLSVAKSVYIGGSLFPKKQGSSSSSTSTIYVNPETTTVSGSNNYFFTTFASPVTTGSTTGSASTVFIEGPPTTVADGYSLFINSGFSFFGGRLQINATSDTPSINPDAFNTMFIYENQSQTTLYSGVPTGSTTFLQNQYIQLTPNTINTFGQIYWRRHPGNAFSANFEIFNGSTGGGNGLSFYWYSTAPPSVTTSYNTGLSSGYNLIFEDNETGINPGTSLWFNGVQLGTTFNNVSTLTNNNFNKVSLVFIRDVIRVFLNGQLIINYQDTENRSITSLNAFLGFTGFCGAKSNFHRIKNIRIGKTNEGLLSYSSPNSDDMYVNCSRLGIGTNTPTSTLSISGTLDVSSTTASTSSSTGALNLAGGLGISSTIDAISSANGGSFTTAGGLAVAKKAFIGSDLTVGGNLIVTGSFVLPHSGLSGLLNDDHTQYALLAGRIGGQILRGGTASGNQLIIRSTSNLSKGNVVFDETTVSTSSSTGSILIAGGIGISNVTDAISSTNGGSITTAGGLAVAKKAFIGTDLTVGGSLTVSGSFVIPHSGLSGLLNDDHTQYALLTGRVGGQILTGGTAASNILTIRSTSNATKGSVLLDETTVSTSTTTGALRVAGGIGISNVTDAISSTNGGSITTAGGLAVAKKAFIGTDLTVGGSLTVSGSFVIPHSGLSGLLNDDHTQYALLAGRVGGQILTGGTAAANQLIIRSTSNLSKGSVVFDETSASTSSSTGSILTAGGIGISNVTDAISSTNGGSITTAGGLAVAKKAFIGTDLSVGSTTLFNNYFQTVNITAPGNPPVNNIRFYSDTTDSLLKSKNSAGVITTYQPINTKGDIVSHNGTTQVRLPVGTNNQVLVANSATTSGLQWIDPTSSSYNSYYIRDERAIGTNGGIATTGAFIDRTLNTITAFPIGTTRVTLSGSDMIFTAGTYEIFCTSPFCGTGNVSTRLFNSTNSTVLLLGTSLRINRTDISPSSFIRGVITIGATSTVNLQYIVSGTGNATALGFATGFQTETYAVVFVRVVV